MPLHCRSNPNQPRKNQPRMKTIENYGQVGDEYSEIEMCYRIVQVKNRKEGELAQARKYGWEEADKLKLGTTCADCGTPAPYVIKEKDDSTWCYCGVCCVGA